MAARQSPEDALKRANAALSTGIFQWKPDYLSAIQHFGSAIKVLKANKAYAQLAATLVRRAQCHAKLSNHLGAGMDYEDAAKALQSGKLQEASNMSIGDLYASSVLEFMGANKTERAADAQLSVLRLACAAGSIQDASDAVSALVSMYTDTEKPVYAADKGKTALTLLLRARMYRTAMTLMLELLHWFTALRQPHNVAKMVLSRTILLLADGEVAGARRELNTATSMDGFVTSAECEAAEGFIAAVEAGDEGNVKQIASASCVTALDNQVCRVAQTGLLNSSSNARTVAAMPSESASMAAALRQTQAGEAQAECKTSTVDSAPSVLDDRAELFAAPLGASTAAAATSCQTAGAAQGEDDLL